MSRARCRRLLRAGALLLGWAAPAAAAAADCRWDHWERFQQLYVSADGRVIDRSDSRQITVSEGQAYALFFALAANDRHGFDKLLRWTEDNLAQGDFSQHLPAWIWGRRDDGNWGVIDSNPASDADLWIAYTLAEAARLWQERRYRVLAALVGRNVLQRETAELPGLGPTLLPAPLGFDEGGGRWRLNPAYAPPQLLRGLAQAQGEAGWEKLLAANRRLLIESAPRGYAPNWALYDADDGFLADSRSQALGSYDSIRVYLWAGLLHADDPDRSALLGHFQPMAAATEAAGVPPERVDTRTAELDGTGYAGFSAALLPFLKARGDETGFDRQLQRVNDAAPELRADAYYENVLTLFGRGGIEGWVRFGADGRLLPRWKERPCVP